MRNTGSMGNLGASLEQRLLIKRGLGNHLQRFWKVSTPPEGSEYYPSWIGDRPNIIPHRLDDRPIPFYFRKHLKTSMFMFAKFLGVATERQAPGFHRKLSHLLATCSLFNVIFPNQAQQNNPNKLSMNVYR